MRQEGSLAPAVEFTNTQLKRSLFLSRGHDRLKVEPDSVTSYLHSSKIQRVLFGRGSIELFKVQAGVTIPLRQKELKVRVSPGSLQFSSRAQEPVQISQTLRLSGGRLEGYTRRVIVTNRSDSVLRLKLLTAHDPTSMNFRAERDPPGEVGVNAFNRGDHVVMDDVGDTNGARVIGFSPAPSLLYMTKERGKATSMLSSGDVPDSVAGMSGAIVIVSQHDAELAPAASLEVSIASLYHDSSLGDVLNELPSLLSNSSRQGEDRGLPNRFACSSAALTDSYNWARSALDSAESEVDPCERLLAGFALGLMRPTWFSEELGSLCRALRKDGSVPRSTERGGPMETSLLVIQAASFLQLRADKRLARKLYPSLKKAGDFLRRSAASGLVPASSSSPDGWRRRLPSGFPTGFTSELNLIVARALKDLAGLAYSLGKGSDSAGFSEAAIRIAHHVNDRLRDAQTGNLALNIDPKGRLHLEQTADQAVALAYNPYDSGLASSLVHRLLEKDFESGYGPRCVPTSNALYYSPAYGDGQLGSCWTRVTLWHSILAYLSGYPSIGGMQLDRVAKVVNSDWEALGGAPGSFPYWIDSERRTAMGSLSDPVAAGLFIEAVVVGELGLGLTPAGPKLAPPGASRLRWILAHDIDLGERGSVFAGRTKDGLWTASTFKRIKTDSSDYQACDLVESSDQVHALSFRAGSSLVVCAGNSSGAPRSELVSVPIAGTPLATTLFADVEELDRESSRWRKVERRRLSDKVEIRINLEPGSWQAFRFART